MRFATERAETPSLGEDRREGRRRAGAGGIVYGLPHATAGRGQQLHQQGALTHNQLVQRGGNEPTVRRSGYQPDDSWYLWSSLIGEACHADSVTYGPWVYLRRRVLAAGSYLVSETSVPSYTATFGGDCDSDGNVTLAIGENLTCTLTNTYKTQDIYLPIIVR